MNLGTGRSRALSKRASATSLRPSCDVCPCFQPVMDDNKLSGTRENLWGVLAKIGHPTAAPFQWLLTPPFKICLVPRFRGLLQCCCLLRRRSPKDTFICTPLFPSCFNRWIFLFLLSSSQDLRVHKTKWRARLTV